MSCIFDFINNTSIVVEKRSRHRETSQKPTNRSLLNKKEIVNHRVKYTIKAIRATQTSSR